MSPIFYAGAVIGLAVSAVGAVFILLGAYQEIHEQVWRYRSRKKGRCPHCHGTGINLHCGCQSASDTNAGEGEE